MNKVNTVIIGGGISGVSFSQKLNEAGIENLIIEKNRNDGCIDTQNYKDFWFEMGAHTIYNSYTDTIDFIKKNKIEDNIITRNKLPFLLVKPNNNIESIFKNLNFFSLIFNYIKNRKISKNDKTVKEYASKLFGEENYNNTLKYCFNAVLSQNSEDFPMEYLFKKYDRDKTIPRSFTLRNGLSSIIQNSQINSIKSNVFNISYNQDKQWLITTDKTSYIADKICLATPWNITKEFLKDILPNIAKHKYSPTMSELTSLAIIIDKNKLDHIKNLAGLIGKEQFFFSAVSRDVVNHPDYRAIVFHCHNNSSQENLVHKIAKLLRIDNADILYSYQKTNLLPCYHRNHSTFLEGLEKELSQIPNLYITGNFFDRLAIENCIRRSNKEANRLISN
ncbi:MULTISPECIES: NAD(P)-binding protein [unclassified Francisella]|uniref:NAD(P)-binding protein n=1 Tax=unclassified Francisella TaxID=2610885 RepID=UPI002E3015EC|nr:MULTISPECIES: NAD(P)-binding protein [unclassified Francisella]MED7820319.1 NAD(P)-binding protein [Francisella sp. 19S2-4]MED7831149.1 NAD(P)-binding protein [Francisella sp. 19S2-10]